MAERFDVVTVGGGLGASSLARSLAEHGYRVLILERETQFRDRVRGEQMASWGAADAKALGIYDLLCDTCARKIPTWEVRVGPMSMPRNLEETTAARLPNLTFYHPEMQERLIEAAEHAGAVVIREARVTDVEPGAAPRVTYERGGARETVEARLVVAADGRSSQARRWGRFAETNGPERLQITGVLLENMRIDESVLRIQFQPNMGRTAILFPQGKGRVRAYFASNKRVHGRLTGDADLPKLFEQFTAIGVPGEELEGIEQGGPLATFDGTESYVRHPYSDGIALIGDAAATTDPTWGQGLSMTVRDARTLRDRLIETDDWDAAGHAYAEAHDRYHDAIHQSEDMWTTLFYEVGPDADARRARAIPRLAQEGFPDPFQSGPESVDVSPEARRHFLAEDLADSAQT